MHATTGGFDIDRAQTRRDNIAALTASRDFHVRWKWTDKTQRDRIIRVIIRVMDRMSAGNLP